MQAIRKQAAFVKEHQLFRAASASHVISILYQLLLRDKIDERVSETIYQLLPKVSKTDVFISHSWSCPAWKKILAICHYLNLHLAVLASLIAAALAVTILVHASGSFSAVAKQSSSLLYGILMCWPMAVFVLTYLFGHLAVDQSSFWFDRLCIPQINLWVRAQTLQHVPVFVAHSSQMLVLWDDTYFERLWCNYELAVHVKAAASKDAPALQLVPMWMPIWTLSSCGLFTIAGFLFAEQGSTTESVDLDSKTAVSLFMSIYNRHFNIPICLYLAVSVVFSWFCFGKVRRHKKMLDQMTNFDLRNARCMLETDRRVITDQVLQDRKSVV